MLTKWKALLAGLTTFLLLAPAAAFAAGGGGAPIVIVADTRKLTGIMALAGFAHNPYEWWHFD